MGVIRDVDEETYEMAMENQINEIKKQSSVKSFDELIDACEQWEI
jgi:2-oxoglutarate ferredoxin oxidoreductase subunit beta